MLVTPYALIVFTLAVSKISILDLESAAFTLFPDECNYNPKKKTLETKKKRDSTKANDANLDFGECQYKT